MRLYIHILAKKTNISDLGKNVFHLNEVMCIIYEFKTFTFLHTQICLADLNGFSTQLQTSNSSQVIQVSIMILFEIV